MTYWKLRGMAAVAAAGLCALACSTTVHRVSGPFDTGWQDDGGQSIAALQRQLSSTALPPASAVAVGVTPTGLVATSLTSKARWKAAGKVTGRPAVAGNLVVASIGDEVVAFDAESGQQRWSLPAEDNVVRGAGDDGSLTAVSLAAGGGSVLWGVDRSGQLILKLETNHALGAPSVLGGIAFVPWQNQYVSAIDLRAGKEVARLLMRERVTHAVNVGGTLYFGERALVRFDDRIGGASLEAANRVSLPERELPGEPTWLRSGVEVPPAGASAHDRVRLYARPTETADGLGIDSGRYVSTYFRIAMGLDSRDASLKWVRTLSESALGGDAAQDGFVLCDRHGDVWLLAAQTGARADKIKLGASLLACVVSAGDLSVPSAKEQGNLATQIGQALALDDTRMDAAQQFLVDELVLLKEPIATKILIDVASNPRTSKALLDRASKHLASRRSGAEYMIAALKRQYDFLSDVLRPPPVGPLADALAAIGEKRAAPLLARHLNDPANSPDDVKRAARALVKLATRSEYEELQTFFSLYRATADSDALLDATIDVARAMLAVGGQDGRTVLQRAASDPLTRPELRKAIATELSHGAAARRG